MPFGLFVDLFLYMPCAYACVLRVQISVNSFACRLTLWNESVEGQEENHPLNGVG